MPYLFPGDGKGNAIPGGWFWDRLRGLGRNIAAAKAQHLCCESWPHSDADNRGSVKTI
jgi:hypothetical protein